VAALAAPWVQPDSTAWAQDSAQVHRRSINGIQLAYEEQGSGPALLLLHGFGGCRDAWKPLLPGLAGHYRVIMPDLRGHGGSTNPSGTFTHRQAALDMFALLDQLGIREFKAMGISSGGMILLHMATQQPKRVEAMVLISATTYFPEQARAIQRHMAAPDSLSPDLLKWMRHCATRGDTQVRDLVRQLNGFKDSYDDMNFTEPFLHTITARTFIVHGDRDPLFPVAIPVQAYGAIPHSYLWIVPNGPHVPIFEPQAKQFEELALAFLRGDWDAH
jgi:pimeloyl-ACP methyl ester carboxylesterase